MKKYIIAFVMTLLVSSVSSAQVSRNPGHRPARIAAIFATGHEDLLRTFGGMEAWTNGASSAPDRWTLSGANATIARDGTNFKIDTYSVRLNANGGFGASLTFLAMSNSGGQSYIRGRTFTLGAWVKATDSTRTTIKISDGIGTSTSAFHSGGDTFEWISIARTVSSSATQLNIVLSVASLDFGPTLSPRFDGVTLVEGKTIPQIN